MGLAIRTGIAPSVWAAEDPKFVATAVEMLEQEAQKHGR